MLVKSISKPQLHKRYNVVISVPYCKLQSMLNDFFDRQYYNAGICGHNFDVYEITPETAIITGYRPGKTIKGIYDLCEKYENQAHTIRHKYGHDYETAKALMQELAEKFVAEHQNQ